MNRFNYYLIIFGVFLIVPITEQRTVNDGKYFSRFSLKQSIINSKLETSTSFSFIKKQRTSKKRTTWKEQRHLKSLIRQIKNLKVKLDRYYQNSSFKTSEKSGTKNGVNRHWKRKLVHEINLLHDTMDKINRSNFESTKVKLASEEKLPKLNFHKKVVEKIKIRHLNRTSKSVTKTNRIYVKRLSMDVKGEPGYQCKAHRDCKPGLCCHMYSNSDTNHSGSHTLSKCVEHKLSKSLVCSNSCQCVFGLNCYHNVKSKFKQNEPTLSPIDATEVGQFKTLQSGQGRCKTPAADDVLHGEYFNSDNSSFNLNTY